ncbi:MAG: hypothetical protein Q9207_008394 [Kuettlingeria erythrocarpa]
MTGLPPERMTPIKVRGKRGQKARLRALQEERAWRPTDEEVVMDSCASAAPLGRPLSKLEGLPVELLESIFLYSQDVNLPRASLPLGRALSSSHLKHKLLRSLLTDPFPEPHDKSEEEFRVGKLQSRLLTCRWLDLASFKRAFAATLTSFLEDALEEPCWGFTKLDDPHITQTFGATDIGLFIPTIPQFVDYHLSDPTMIIPEPWSIGRADQWDIGFSWTRAYFREPQPALSTKFRLRKGCEVPTRLLHGPWTKEKKQFLCFMIFAGPTWDPVGSNNLEVADQSLREAIVQGNTEVVAILREIFFTPYPHRIPVTVEHLRLAVFQGGGNPKIIELLTPSRMADQHFDWGQDDIVDWANGQKDREGGREDGRGAWLLERIDRVARKDYPFFPHLRKMFAIALVGWEAEVGTMCNTDCLGDEQL